jgi:hypothetical protein
MLPIKFQYIWLKGLQRRRLKYEKFTDGRRRQTSSDVNSSPWQGELKKNGENLPKNATVCFKFLTLNTTNS